MDQVTLSVSQLRCACLDPQWLRAYLAGENPSTFAPSPEVGRVHGADFHALAETFINWLVIPAHAARPWLCATRTPSCCASGSSAAIR